MKIRTIIILLAFLAFFIASVGGYLFYNSMQDVARTETRKEVDVRMQELSSRIDLYLAEYQKISITLAGLGEIRQALGNVRSDSIKKAETVLGHFQRSLAIDVCYVIDRSGGTIASSNHRTPESFVGRNYAFRPYFKRAIFADSGVSQASVTATASICAGSPSAAIAE